MVERPSVCVCPRCDGQGLVNRFEIRATGEAIYLCDECDALWQTEAQIGVVQWQDFQTFMQAKGLTGTAMDELK
jgi:hypothetical protein